MSLETRHIMRRRLRDDVHFSEALLNLVWSGIGRKHAMTLGNSGVYSRSQSSKRQHLWNLHRPVCGPPISPLAHSDISRGNR
jgi:hypothetical protein